MNDAVTWTIAGKYRAAQYNQISLSILSEIAQLGELKDINPTIAASNATCATICLPPKFTW